MTQRRYVMELRPPRAGSDHSTLVGLPTVLFPHLLIVGFCLAAAVSFAPARVYVALYLAFYLAAAGVVVTLVVRRLRLIRRGVIQPPRLWLTDTEVGYTDARGNSVSCARTAVASAIRAIMSTGRFTRDLLIFRDAADNALLTVPLGPWSPAAVDELGEQLGINSPPRRFFSSADELERVAHGATVPAVPKVVGHIRLVVYGVAALIVLVVIVASAVSGHH